MRRTVGIAAGIIGAAVIGVVALSCGDSTSPTPPTYTATLSAANEVRTPPVTSTAAGVVTFVDRGTFFEWTMVLNNITGVTQSHIHAPALAGVNAGVIINLFMPNVTTAGTGTLNGQVATGTITDANNPSFTVAAVRDLFIAGTAYANVHTAAFPGGEIRGQIARSN